MENKFEKIGEQPPPKDEHDTSTIYINNGGKLELVRQEPAETFDPEDEYKMAEQGLIVLPVELGQNVYRYIEGDAL